MKRPVATFVAAFLIASAAATPTAASEDNYCNDHFPSVKFDYDTETARVLTVFDLKRCLKVDADLVITGSFSRDGFTGDGGITEGMRVCGSSRKKCRFSLEWEHDLVERADYQANIDHFAEDEDGSLQAGALTLSATCTSAVVTAECGL